jgi:hypothetical protein
LTACVLPSGGQVTWPQGGQWSQLTERPYESDSVDVAQWGQGFSTRSSNRLTSTWALSDAPGGRTALACGRPQVFPGAFPVPSTVWQTENKSATALQHPFDVGWNNFAK